MIIHKLITDRGIMFRDWCVRAILSGSHDQPDKWQTRRTRGLDFINQSPGDWSLSKIEPDDNGSLYTVFTRGDYACRVRCPYGIVGDMLWAKETYQICDNNEVIYRAGQPFKESHISGVVIPVEIVSDTGWRSSMMMPRRYSRIDLETTNIRCQRITDITVPDLFAEGVVSYVKEQNRCVDDDITPYNYDRSLRNEFRQIIDGINGVGTFDRGVWVWALSFERVKP